MQASLPGFPGQGLQQSSGIGNKIGHQGQGDFGLFAIVIMRGLNPRIGIIQPLFGRCLKQTVLGGDAENGFRAVRHIGQAQGFNQIAFEVLPNAIIASLEALDHRLGNSLFIQFR